MSGSGSRFDLDDLVVVALDRVDLSLLADFEVPRDHDQAFKQGYDVLEEWVRGNEGLQAHRDLQVTTTVALVGEVAAGYIATSAFEIDKRHQGMKDADFRKPPYSGLKILHLAVKKGFEGRGLGEALLYSLGIGTAALISRATGCRFVYLDALVPAVPFYAKHQFVTIPTGRSGVPQAVPMVFDLLKAGPALDGMAEVAASMMASAAT